MGHGAVPSCHFTAPPLSTLGHRPAHTATASECHHSSTLAVLPVADLSLLLCTAQHHEVNIMFTGMAWRVTAH